MPLIAVVDRLFSVELAIRVLDVRYYLSKLGELSTFDRSLFPHLLCSVFYSDRVH